VLLHNHRHFAKVNQYLARFAGTADMRLGAWQNESNEAGVGSQYLSPASALESKRGGLGSPARQKLKARTMVLA